MRCCRRRVLAPAYFLAGNSDGDAESSPWEDQRRRKGLPRPPCRSGNIEGLVVIVTAEPQAQQCGWKVLTMARRAWCEMVRGVAGCRWCLRCVTGFWGLQVEGFGARWRALAKQMPSAANGCSHAHRRAAPPRALGCVVVVPHTVELVRPYHCSRAHLRTQSPPPTPHTSRPTQAC